MEYENSLAAFRAAGGLGADGVELDVHATTDGALIVHHDPTIAGVVIARVTATEIAALRLPNGEPVPTLPQALAAAGALRVFIEIKTLPPQWDAQLFQAMERGPNPAGYAVHAFDHRIIQRLRRQRPQLAAGVLSASYLADNVSQIRAAGAQVLWEDYTMVDRDLVDEVHDADFALYAWTPDDAAELTRLAGLGVDGSAPGTPTGARGRRMAPPERVPRDERA